MDSKIHPVEHSYFEMRRIIYALTAKYPFIKLENIGRSVAGRDIQALTVGSAAEYTLFITGDDPCCRITSLILLTFIEEVCEKILKGENMCGINIRKAMFGKGIIVVPLLNPDGTEIALRGEMGCGYMAGKISKMCSGDFAKWRANLRGVEISKNLSPEFDFLKQKEKGRRQYFPSFCGFCGYNPDSEPESVAFLELCRQKSIRQLIYLSAVGGTVAYSGFPKVPHPSAKMAEVMAAVSGLYVEPPINKPLTELSDRFTYEFLKPGISVKIGEESIPPVRELNYHYGRIKELLTLSALF